MPPLRGWGLDEPVAINISRLRCFDLAGGGQGGEKALSIQMVPKNLFTPIAPAHHVIDSSLVLDSQLARHRQLFDPISNLCQ